MTAKVVSGFPGIGKSVLSARGELRTLDSDSSKFSWLREGVRHPDFPTNYMNHIISNLDYQDFIFVSSHDTVREALEDRGIDYTLVYPAVECKQEYIERYKQRGNTDSFVDFIDSHWEQFISDIESETFPRLVKLQPGQYLSDVLEEI